MSDNVHQSICIQSMPEVSPPLYVYLQHCIVTCAASKEDVWQRSVIAAEPVNRLSVPGVQPTA